MIAQARARRAAFAIVLTCGLSGIAQARPSTLNMSCAQAAGTVTQQGAIVLGTGGYTYDRFVRHAGFCQPTEIGRRAFVPTRDNPQCLIGFTCYEPSRNDRFSPF